jgi:N-acetylglucosaminyldiphosphoundecaprenol N-acetyl-beta-D-mannosaminyltransferase
MLSNKFPAYSYLGMKVQALSKTDLLGVIESTIKSGADNAVIGNQNLHSLYLLHHDAKMKEYYDINSYTHVDGMSLIILARLLGVPLQRVHRAAYLDWFEDFLRMAEDMSWRIYFLGGKRNVADHLSDRLRVDYPRLKIMSHHGYDAFTPATSVYAEIEEYAPHVVLVGMGMPLQEKWILQARTRIHTNVFFQCGAIMDYLMGEQKMPPRWLGNMGLEWLYRLLSRPQALCVRYLVEPIRLLPLIMREMIRRKIFAEK